MNRINRKSGLLLSPTVFKALHEALITALKENYRVSPETLVDYQVYGFNDYDENAPSIKKMILDRTGKWVNGKYLYNKYREWKKGVSPIKLNREFVFIYFTSLGYKDAKDFIISKSFSEGVMSEQINLEKTITAVFENEYYVGYYIGEEENIIVTRLTLFQATRKVRFSLAYWEKEDAYSEYVYDGTILYQKNGLSLLFKNEDNDLDRSQLINIFCEPYQKIKPILVGAYSGYDRNRQPVIGEIIFQRVNSVEEQKAIIRKKEVNSIIAQYLSGKRWKSLGKTLQNITNLSPESKFVGIIDDFIQTYRGIFVSIEEGVFLIELDIQNNLGNAVFSIAGHPLYKGIIKVQTSGQLLIGRFTNTTTQAPLFISIEVLPMSEGLFSGSMMGISRFDKSFSGKLYLSHEQSIKKQLPKYRGSELTPVEIKNLPDEILDNLSKIIKNNRLEKYYQFTQEDLSSNYLHHLVGNYEVIPQGKQPKILTIKKDGKSRLSDKHLIYSGKAMLCEGGFLSIYFTNCNGIPHCGQIMGKVGRMSINELKEIKANWLYLDEMYNQQIIEVILIPIQS